MRAGSLVLLPRAYIQIVNLQDLRYSVAKKRRYIMEKFFELLKQNPKKAIFICLAAIVLAIGNILSGCAYKLHIDKADNLTHSIDIKG
uniref:Uncharacterized protein n=1 Tax=Dulem virus 204 TaxID=3145681 RepID=A0AAU8AZE0_9VIRU